MANKKTAAKKTTAKKTTAKKRAAKQPISSETKRQDTQKALKKLLKPSLNPQGKIDPNAIRKNNPVLADVLNEFALSKSARTDPENSAKLISQALESRDPDSSLAKALARLEREMRKRR